MVLGDVRDLNRLERALDEIPNLTDIYQMQALKRAFSGDNTELLAHIDPADFEKYAKQVIEKTKKECGQFFRDDHLTYLWSWCIKCPHCGQRFPLTNQMYIVNSPKKKIGIKSWTQIKRKW